MTIFLLLYIGRALVAQQRLRQSDVSTYMPSEAQVYVHPETEKSSLYRVLPVGFLASLSFLLFVFQTLSSYQGGNALRLFNSLSSHPSLFNHSIYLQSVYSLPSIYQPISLDSLRCAKVLLVREVSARRHIYGSTVLCRQARTEINT